MAERQARPGLSPSAVLRKMGDDLLIVDEEKQRVVVLDPAARLIFYGVVRGLDDVEIARQLAGAYLDVEGVDLESEVARLRTELADAGILERRRGWARPTIKVSDLKDALKDMDLTRSEVTYYVS